MWAADSLDRLRKPPTTMQLSDMRPTPILLSFLAHLEGGRGDTVRSRNGPVDILVVCRSQCVGTGIRN